MDKQFTASEVRHTATEIEGKQMLVSSMLRAFADLLEAQEKAVPVAYAAGLEANMRGFLDVMAWPEGEFTIPLYTHSAPSDADRLAEALRAVLEAMYTAGGRDDDGGRPNSATEQIEHAERIALAALTAHSAQAQPPAARVTDAMVNRLTCWMIAQFGECRAPTDHKARIEWWCNQARSALHAALAAQENPNG